MTKKIPKSIADLKRGDPKDGNSYPVWKPDLDKLFSRGLFHAIPIYILLCELSISQETDRFAISTGLLCAVFHGNCSEQEAERAIEVMIELDILKRCPNADTNIYDGKPIPGIRLVHPHPSVRTCRDRKWGAS